MNGYRQPQRNSGEMLKQLFLGNSMLSRLIQINTVVFIIVKIVSLFAFLSSADPVHPLSVIGQYMALPASFHVLASKPWTIITYMFLHEGFFHILFNIVMLYFGGILFTEYLGEKRLLWTYLAGGIVGALFYLFSFNIFPVFAQVKSVSVALGASASVLAIIVATAIYVPDYTVHLMLFGRVKLKYVAIAFVAIDLLSIPAGNPGGHIAHLGGAFWGFIYALSLKNGTDLYRFLNVSAYTPKAKSTFSYEKQEYKRPVSDDEYNEQKIKKQKKIDEILDKISKSGYSSLTKEEKEFLFKTSKKN
ncbi:MAG: rhomboid family intramembrane serine protease [Bacteroidetes bacterium]|nr:MAG: rhomboid family intramembrane serine protease [Bacteroidota bacterium]RLD40281.1 MAG: rhomboid family intramembrane serine protease [Bacteroidota bacterium]RLD74656.1 MAG: rhomboid family intramembrane serine protease [Bacteroidota bacterium]RLD87045.1 MAG: rhomboid family intramembrane serine protease [Bacteroidota bacterium]